MKKYALLSMMIFISIKVSLAQAISKSMINHTPGYTISISIQNENFTYTYNKPSTQDGTTFTISPNEELAFTRGFKNLVKDDMKALKLITLPSKFKQGDSVDIEVEARLLFSYFKGIEDVSDDLLYQPIAGTLDIIPAKYTRVTVFLKNNFAYKRAAKDSVKKYKEDARNIAEKRKLEIILANLKTLEKASLKTLEKTNLKKTKAFQDSVKKLFLDSTKKIETILEKFEKTQSYKPWYIKRWYKYEGVRYSEHDFKLKMRDEIPKIEDEQKNDYGKAYRDNEKNIEKLLYLNRVYNDSLKALSAALAKSNQSLKKIKDDTGTFVIRYTKLMSPILSVNSSSSYLYKIRLLSQPKSNKIKDLFKKSGNGMSFDIIRKEILNLTYDSSDFSDLKKFWADSLTKTKNQTDRVKVQADKYDQLYKRTNDRLDKLKKLINSADFKTLEKKFDSLTSVLPQVNLLIKDSSDKKKQIASITYNQKKVRESLDSIRLVLLKGINDEYKRNRFEQAINVKSIQIEITDGFIENMQVVGQVGNQFKYLNEKLELRDTIVDRDGIGEIKLGNKHPFGFSRKVDYANLEFKYLYIINDDRKNPSFKLYIRDLLTAKTYVEELANYRRDYSPQDTVIKYRPGQSDNHYVLKKDPTYRLFEGRIYTDLVGLDRTSPNGLVQVQVDKKINLITRRNALGKSEWCNAGFFGYITPAITFSKIEQSNKDLLLNRIDTVEGKYAPVKYASTLDLKRHENFSTGFDLNLGIFDIPTAKSTFQLDFGLRYGRVAIVDSTAAIINGSMKKVGSNFGVNTFRIYPRVGWLIRTDERYSLYFEGGFNWYWLRDESFVQVANNDVFRSTMNAGGHDTNKYLNFLFEATLNTGVSKKANKGKLFFRYQYNQQYGYFNTGFSQAQFGYSFYLLKK